MDRRPRRNRKNATIRGWARESFLRPENLIAPLFLIEGENKQVAIESLPGCFRESLDVTLKTIETHINLGINSFVLFPVIPEDKKDKTGSYSYHKDNFYLDQIRKIKAAFPDCVLMSDVALDPYSSDGHDGIVQDGEILNDPTLDVLNKMAVAQAEAGIDIIGPSDMMDGRIGSIRESLDNSSLTNTSIMSYCAKYASAFYGPFRDALDSAPKDGDKKTYQMDWANSRESLVEAELDYAEGADFLMVKPALAYLDIIALLKANFDIPIAAYNVSGEYAMLHAAAEKGWLNLEQTMVESLGSIHRAGADIILTYFAKDYALWYKKHHG